MPDPAKMEAAIHSYVDAFAKQDASLVAALFAEDCVVEDPVGTPPHKGREAVHQFYTHSVGTGAKLTLAGPVRIAGEYAAFAFSVRVDMEGVPHQIDVIDVMRFNDDNKIIEMRAYFGPMNIGPA